MEKRLYLFLGVAILVGGFQLIISRQDKKVSTFTQCCDGGCACGDDKEGRDKKN